MNSIMLRCLLAGMLLAVSALLGSCSDGTPSTSSEHVQKLGALASEGEFSLALSVYEDVPQGLKAEVDAGLKAKLPTMNQWYWVFVGLRLGLADRDVFVETIRNGPDPAFLGCMAFCPRDSTDWRGVLDTLSQRWGEGDWDHQYDVAAWNSLAKEDFREWRDQERKVLLDLLIRSLKDTEEWEQSISVYEVAGSAFDVESISGKTIYDMAMLAPKKDRIDDDKLAAWLHSHRTELLARAAPKPKEAPSIPGNLQMGPRAPWASGPVRPPRD